MPDGTPADGRAPDEVPPLAGYTVAVTAARRREELGALLDRRGARVLYAPAIRIVPLADDAELVTATRAVLAAPVDLVVATTGVGFRGWLEAAEAWDLPLAGHLQAARILARGPKARGAIRGAGLRDVWSPASESSAEVLEHLRSGAEGPLAGTRVAVQLHGDPLPDILDGLRAEGAEVLPVPVYRWELPDDLAPVQRLVHAATGGTVDAVTFTSAPAAAGLLQVAADLGRREELVASLRGDVVPFAVGPVTAAPLEAVGVRPLQPERARLGALAREVVTRLPQRDPVVPVGGSSLQVRGHAAVLDGRVVELSPGPLAVLRALAARPGVVLARTELQELLPGGGDAHAVEMAVTRLRAALRAPLVETVVKRGYRLTA
jgi:uroporphyrinogen-III synthase